MATPYMRRARADGFDHRPRDYENLRQRVLSYGRDHLAGRTITNRATQLSVTLTPEALADATRDGARHSGYCGHFLPFRP